MIQTIVTNIAHNCDQKLSNQEEKGRERKRSGGGGRKKTYLCVCLSKTENLCWIFDQRTFNFSPRGNGKWERVAKCYALFSVSQKSLFIIFWWFYWFLNCHFNSNNSTPSFKIFDTKNKDPFVHKQTIGQKKPRKNKIQNRLWFTKRKPSSSHSINEMENYIQVVALRWIAILSFSMYDISD